MSRRANRQGSVFWIESKHRWCAQLDGKRKLFALRQDADEHLRMLLNERAEGQPIVRNKHTLAEWMPTWLPRHAARKQLSVTTVATDDSYIRRHSCPSKLGKRTFDADGWPQPIEDFLTDKLMEGLSPASVRQIRAILSGAFGAPFDPSNMRREFYAVCDKAGVPRIKPHGLRHTSATNDLMAGTPQTVVMDKHGWSQEKMVRRYQHVPLAVKQQWAAASAQFLPQPTATGTNARNK